MNGYTAQEVSEMLGLPLARLRAYVRDGLLAGGGGDEDDWRFTFQDLVLIRTAEGLVNERIPAHRVRRVLRQVRQRLQPERTLSGVSFTVEGDRILVVDGGVRWQADSGQMVMDFAPQQAPRGAVASLPNRRQESAEPHYERGCELETSSVEGAKEAYRRALELNPHHPDAHVNLGRLLHEAGAVEEALVHYRAALSAAPHHVTAAFNGGVALEDLGRYEEAAEAYRTALAIDGRYADAHFNLARLCERAGDRHGALRHLRLYREITQSPL